MIIIIDYQSMPSSNSNNQECGSLWHRWDPHIHTPGTILNDQYGGSGAWNEWLSRIEDSSPNIEAIGVTDYLSLDQYEIVLAHKHSGRLSNVGFIFPNVKMRFGIGTSKDSPINFHLLFSPEAEDHVDQIRGFFCEN